MAKLCGATNLDATPCPSPLLVEPRPGDETKVNSCRVYESWKRIPSLSHEPSGRLSRSERGRWTKTSDAKDRPSHATQRTSITVERNSAGTWDGHRTPAIAEEHNAGLSISNLEEDVSTTSRRTRPRENASQLVLVEWVDRESEGNEGPRPGGAGKDPRPSNSRPRHQQRLVRWNETSKVSNVARSFPLSKRPSIGSQCPDRNAFSIEKLPRLPPTPRKVREVSKDRPQPDPKTVPFPPRSRWLDRDLRGRIEIFGMGGDTAGVLGAVYVTHKSTMAARKLVPLLDRVLVEKILPQAKSAGGVLLPESVASRTHEGRVLAVGPGRYSRDGERMPVSVQEGETVLLPEFGGNQVKVDGKELYLYRDEDILGVLKD